MASAAANPLTALIDRAEALSTQIDDTGWTGTVDAAWLCLEYRELVRDMSIALVAQAQGLAMLNQQLADKPRILVP